MATLQIQLKDTKNRAKCSAICVMQKGEYRIGILPLYFLVFAEFILLTH